MLRVVVLNDIPTPYRTALFNELHMFLQGQKIELKIIFFSQNVGIRQWQEPLHDAVFQYVICRSIDVPLGRNRQLTIPWDLYWQLRRFRPDLIVTNGFSVTSFIVRRYSKLSRIPFLIWSGGFGKRAKEGSLRHRARRYLIRNAKGFVAYGSLAANYLEHLGAPTNAIHTSPNTIDTTFFAEEAAHIRKNLRAIRKRYHFGKYNILCVGQLIKRKGVNHLLEAGATLKKKHKIDDFIMHIIGDGPEKDGLRELSERLSISENVAFCGFLQSRELVQFYSISDLFVFPTNFDVWGLVLNEAMASGLPVIASIHAGAAYDLIEDSLNGYLVDPADHSDLAEKMARILKDKKLRQDLGKRAQDTMRAKYTLKMSAKRFVAPILELLPRV